ncbi:membrane hypothetical protein [Acidobacteriia bacterium SbA2]|nr:membrane hypothetical protein [Acidobacteriia bacterium SbA2]
MTERICPFGRMLADPPFFKARVRPGGVRLTFPWPPVVVPFPPAVTPFPAVVDPGRPAVPPVFPAVFVPAVFPAVPVFVRPFIVVFVRPLVVVPVLPIVLVPVLPAFMVLVWPVEPGMVRVVALVWLGVVVCCVGPLGRLGAELWAGALAWGAGALARGAGALGCGAGAGLCWARANAGITIRSTSNTCVLRVLPLIMKFIAYS